MRLRHVAAEMEHGQRKVMNLISVTSFSQRVFNSGWVLVTTIRRVSAKMMVTAFAFSPISALHTEKSERGLSLADAVEKLREKKISAKLKLGI